MHGWDELLGLRVVRRLVELAGRFGVAVGFVDAEGEPVAPPRGVARPARPLCEAVGRSSAGRASCAGTGGVLVEVLRDRAAEAAVDTAPIEWRCHAGLRVFAAPLVTDGELWGAVYAAGHVAADRADDLDPVRAGISRFPAPGDGAAAALPALLPSVPALTDEARGWLRELVDVIAREIRDYRTEAGRRARARELGEERARFEAMVGRSPAMNALYRLVEKVAPADTSVLVTGENGTGKELVARAIHERSPRRDRPFVGLSCAAFNENLLESELFGHVRGAFTGAVAEKKGLFEVADGGTLFLDEIGETSPAMQVKLLRVLQEGAFLPVGATRPVEVDVRVVAATHRDLSALVKSGGFREDLFYRIHVIELHVPPLRERPEDLPILVEHFLDRHVRPGRPRRRLTPRALDRLAAYAWPGNVRELENEIERLVVLSGDAPLVDVPLLSEAIRASGAGGPIRPGAPMGSLPQVVASVERRMIAEALARHGGNRTHVARELGISRRNLIRKLRTYGLEDAGRARPEEALGAAGD